MKYNIADVTLEVEGAETKLITERLYKYSYLSKSESLPDISVSYYENDKIEICEDSGLLPDKVSGWKWKLDGETVTAYDVKRTYDFVLSSVMLNYKNKRAVIQVHDTCPFSGVKAEQVFFNLIGYAFALLMPQYNGIVFHSSAFSYKGNGILISAPSGTGKSTHTSLWKKQYGDDVVIFNDDSPVIRSTEDGLFAYGTPWSGKTAINEPLKVPLKAIVCIRQGAINSIKRLDVKTAFFCLFNETFKIPDKNNLDKIMDVLNSIITHIPVYELECTISKEAVELLKNELNL